MNYPSPINEVPAMRKEVIGNAELWLADCRDILPSLPKVDAVITDPPFNAFKEGIENDSLPPEEWREFCRSFASLVRAENILVEVGKNDSVMRAELDAVHKYRWAITLNYTNAMRQGACGYSNTGLVLWYGEGKCHNRYMDRIDAPLEETKSEFSHPSPKTTAHYQRLVDMFTTKNGMVIDPFMGSGTTGIACMNLGRSFIGIECEPKYFDIACRRIEDAQRQGRLIA